MHFCSCSPSGHPCLQESTPAPACPLLPLLRVQELTGTQLGLAPGRKHCKGAPLGLGSAGLQVFAEGWEARVEGSKGHFISHSSPCYFGIVQEAFDVLRGWDAVLFNTHVSPEFPSPTVRASAEHTACAGSCDLQFTGSQIALDCKGPLKVILSNPDAVSRGTSN